MTRDEARIWLAQNPDSIVRDHDGDLYRMTQWGDLQRKNGDMWVLGTLTASIGTYFPVSCDPAPALPELGEKLEDFVAQLHKCDGKRYWTLEERNELYRLLLARALELCAEQTRQQIEGTKVSVDGIHMEGWELRPPGRECE